MAIPANIQNIIDETISSGSPLVGDSRREIVKCTCKILSRPDQPGKLLVQALRVQNAILHQINTTRIQDFCQTLMDPSLAYLWEEVPLKISGYLFFEPSFINLLVDSDVHTWTAIEASGTLSRDEAYERFRMKWTTHLPDLHQGLASTAWEGVIYTQESIKEMNERKKTEQQMKRGKK
jgi:hypothetical protein